MVCQGPIHPETHPHLHCKWYIWGLLCIYWTARVERRQEMRDTDAFKPGMLWFMVAISPATHTHTHDSARHRTCQPALWRASAHLECSFSQGQLVRTLHKNSNLITIALQTDWHILVTVAWPPQLTRVLNECVRTLPRRKKLKHVQFPTIQHRDHRDLDDWEPWSKCKKEPIM